MFLSQWGASSSNGLNVVFNGKIGHIDLPVPKGCWDNTLNSKVSEKYERYHFSARFPQQKPWSFTQNPKFYSDPPGIHEYHPKAAFKVQRPQNCQEIILAICLLPWSSVDCFFFREGGNHGKSVGFVTDFHITQVCLLIIWLVVSTHLKNISQNGNLPQIGVKIKNIWNHHLVICWVLHPVTKAQNSITIPSLGKSRWGLSTVHSFNYGFNDLFLTTTTWSNSEASYNS